MFCKCCCKPVLTDDFNRADNTDLGSSWVEISSGTEIKSNTLQIASPGLIRTEGITYPSVTVDSVNYSGSSKVSVKWTPLDTSNPVVSHVIFGQRDILGGTAISRYIGLELTCDSSGIAPTISARLYTAGPTYITDSLPIGWDDGPFYTSGASYDASDKYFDITLCWEPMRYYSLYSRTGMAVKATIGSYTGAFYTLEGVVSGAPTIQDVFLECSSGTARWDDFSWRRTKPDFVNCPYCGQCLFAADMTTADDQGTAAYSSSGGTFARNVTTGALELTSTTATWLVDLPARSSLSLTYDADWAGSSPTFTVALGFASVAITKSGSLQSVTATINGTPQASFTAPLDSNTISICFLDKRVVVTVGTSSQDYETPDNSGYTNVVLTAGTSMVSVGTVRATRSDEFSITTLGCDPCNLVTSPCVVCSPDDFSPYGLLYVSAAVEVVADLPIRALNATGVGWMTDLTAINAVGPCTPGWTSPEFPPGVQSYTETQFDTCLGGDEVPAAVVADQDGTAAHGAVDVPRNATYDPPGGSSFNYAVCSWIYYDQLCQCTYSTDPGDASKKPIATYTVNVTVFKVDGTTNKFYLGARVTFDDAVCPPQTMSMPPFLYRCSGGVAVALGTNRISYVDYYSDLFEISEPNCALTDFTLSTTDDGTYDVDIGTITYPATINIHVPR